MAKKKVNIIEKGLEENDNGIIRNQLFVDKSLPVVDLVNR